MYTYVTSAVARAGRVLSLCPEVLSVYMVHEWPYVDGSFHGLCAKLTLSQSRSQSVTLALVKNDRSALYLLVLEFAITRTLILTFSAPVTAVCGTRVDSCNPLHG